MKTAVLPVLLLTIFACAEEPIRKELERPEWEKTEAQLPEGTRAIFSAAYGGKLYVQFPHNLVSIDTTMYIRDVRKSDAEAKQLPMPALVDGMYCVFELERYVVQARRADTLRVHFIDVNSDARLSLNLTALRKQLGLSYNFGSDALAMSINSEGKVLIVVDSHENDTHKMYGITYQVNSSLGEIELSDRRLFEIGPFETLPVLSSSGSTFYLSVGVKTYSIDGEQVTLLDKDDRPGSTDVRLTGSPLGLHKGRIYYGDRSCEAPIYYTEDMKNVGTVLIYNDDAKCFSRLGVMNGYLYSFDEDGVLYRLKL